MAGVISPIRWNRSALRQIRQAKKVEDNLGARAERVAAACGEGFVAEQGQGKTRARAAVITATGEAIRKNASENTILHNLDRAR